MDRLGHVLKAEGEAPVIPDVRTTDLEPYVGLRYLSKLFKLMGIVLLLLLVAEIIIGRRGAGKRGDPDAARRGEPAHRAGWRTVGGW